MSLSLLAFLFVLAVGVDLTDDDRAKLLKHTLARGNQRAPDSWRPVAPTRTLGGSRRLALPDLMRPVQTDEEVRLFWELHPTFTRGNRTDFAAMTREWNLRVGEGLRSGTCDLYIKHAGLLKAFQNELAQQLCMRDTTALNSALAVRRPTGAQLQDPHVATPVGTALLQGVHVALLGGVAGDAGASRPSPILSGSSGSAMHQPGQAGKRNAMAVLMRSAAAGAARRYVVVSLEPGSAGPSGSGAAAAARVAVAPQFAGQVAQAGLGGTGVAKRCKSCLLRGLTVQLSYEHLAACPYRKEDGSRPPKQRKKE